MNEDQMTKSMRLYANEMKKELEMVESHPGNKFAKQQLKNIEFDVENLIEVLTKITSEGAGEQLKKSRWKVYFAEFKDLSEDQQVERRNNNDRYAALQRLKKLNVGG